MLPLRRKQHLHRSMPSYASMKTTNNSSNTEHASRHIIVNTDDEEKDRYISTGKRSLGH